MFGGGQERIRYRHAAGCFLLLNVGKSPLRSIAILRLRTNLHTSPVRISVRSTGSLILVALLAIGEALLPLVEFGAHAESVSDFLGRLAGKPSVS